jgi:hypothetical protein
MHILDYCYPSPTFCTLFPSVFKTQPITMFENEIVLCRFKFQFKFKQ